MTPEGRVKGHVKKWLKSAGWWWCTPATGGYGASGVPDFLACRPVLVTADMVGTIMGQFIGIETKAPGKRANTTDLQDRQIMGIHKAGGAAIVIDDVTQLEEAYPCS